MTDTNVPPTFELSAGLNVNAKESTFGLSNFETTCIIGVAPLGHDGRGTAVTEPVVKIPVRM
jgi:hypothetical protein